MGNAALALALLSVVVWFALLVSFKREWISDESTHLPVIQRLLQGEMPPAGRLPMPPTMHLLYAAVMSVVGPSLTAGRAISAALSICAVAIFHAAARIRHRDAAGAHTLLMATNPLFLPYSVLVYTEPASMAALAAGLYLHERRRMVAAGVALLAACLVRQSNIVWVLLLAATAVIDDAGRPPPAEWRAALRRSAARLWPYLILTGLFCAVVAVNPSGLISPTDNNRAGFSRAQFYLFFFVCAIVFLPIWIERARLSWGEDVAPRLARAGTWTLLIGAVAVVAMLYDNPHHWNAGTGHLHNRFLVLMSASAAFRAGVATLIVLMLLAAIATIARSEQRGVLIAAWLAALLFLAPHRMVDQRYYIFPLLLVTYYWRLTPRQARRQCVWQIALAACTVGYTLAFGGPNRGL